MLGKKLLHRMTKRELIDHLAVLADEFNRVARAVYDLGGSVGVDLVERDYTEVLITRVADDAD